MEEIEKNTVNNNPLVSIVVITYNSAKYVLETLESAKAQTYQNIELIVSDDCSTDNTVEICRNWIDENKGRFVRTELITVEKNTGIAPNCNRGVSMTKGVWFKLIAGDDIFLEDAIEKGIQFSYKNPSISIFASKAKKMIDDTIQNEDINRKISKRQLLFYTTTDPKLQFKLLMHNNYITAPTVFIKKSLWEIVRFNEEICNIEDYPFWIEVTRIGFQIGFLNDYTIIYRLHIDSESGYNTNALFNSLYKKDFNFRKMYLFEYYD